MPDYFLAMDGHGEICLWAPNPDRPSHPRRVLGENDVPASFWPDVVARMTGTVVTNDDAIVDAVARALYENDEDMTGRKSLPWDSANMAAFEGDWVREQYRTPARAVLAALTGVPHAR